MTDLPDLIAGALGVSRGTAYDMMRECLAEVDGPADEPVDLSQFYCGAARIRDGEYKLMDMRAVDALVADWRPIYAIPEHLIEHLYTAPQQREWVGLTDEETNLIVSHHGFAESIVRATEAKLREKNT